MTKSLIERHGRIIHQNQTTMNMHGSTNQPETQPHLKWSGSTRVETFSNPASSCLSQSA